MVKFAIMGDCGQAPPMQAGKSVNPLPILSSDAKTRTLPAPGGDIKTYHFFSANVFDAQATRWWRCEKEFAVSVLSARRGHRKFGNL